MSKKDIPVEDAESNDAIDKQSTEETTALNNSSEKEEEQPEAEDTANVVEELPKEEEKEETEENADQNPPKEEAATKKNGAKKAVSDKESLQKELSEMKDKYLRIFAEFDNYRKRTIKERMEIIKLAAKDSLVALLPAIDDFARAIKVGNDNDNEEKIPEGIILIYNKLYKALEQQGIKEMESTGQDFDPELHEALTKIPAPTEDMKGKVIDTIEKGYYLNDKIIRYAKVIVGE